MSFLIYKIIPNKKISSRSALQAAFFTSLFWEIAKQLFGWYVLRLGRFSVVYGSLSTLAIFFLLLYYSSAILILGGEVAFLLEERKVYPPDNSSLKKLRNKVGNRVYRIAFF
jgi:membrane protein